VEGSKAWLLLHFDGVINEVMTGLYKYHALLDNGTTMHASLVMSAAYMHAWACNQGKAILWQSRRCAARVLELFSHALTIHLPRRYLLSPYPSRPPWRYIKPSSFMDSQEATTTAFSYAGLLQHACREGDLFARR